MKKKRSKRNTLLTYAIWTIITIGLILWPFSREVIEIIALPLVIILLIKDVFWDIVLKKGTTIGFEHAPVVLLFAVAGLFEFMQLSILAMALFLVDFVIDIMNDFGIV